MITIIEFKDINEQTGDPIYPADVRRDNLALNVAHQLSDHTRMISVYTDSAIHLRVLTNRENDEGQIATQYDPYLPADATVMLLVRRDSGNRPWIYAVADV